MGKDSIVFPDSLRHGGPGPGPCFRKVQEFCYIGHADLYRTWRAVGAVHAVSLPADLRKSGEGGCIVPFLLGSVLIGEALKELLHRVGTRKDHGNAGAGQGIMDALVHGERRAGGRELRIQKVASAEAFHDSDADAPLRAEFVQALPFRIHIGELGSIGLVRPELLHIFICRLQVITGVDAEHQHFDGPAFHGFDGDLGIVAGETDMADASFFFQFPGIVQDPVVQDLLPVRKGVTVMDHADVDVISLQEGHHFLESCFCLRQVPGPEILAVFPDGADVGLDDEFLSASLQGISHRRPELRI